ncbi:MAG: hypothetical protein V9G19_09415 [Tetrasphaera sp.]
MTKTATFTDITDEITLDDLIALANLDGPCISIYLPTRRAQHDPAHDGLVLRELIDRAALELQTMSLGPGDAHTLLTPLRELTDDRRFWTTQADGLALFATAEELTVLRLPAPVAASVRAGWRAHVLPLIPLATGEETFHVLAFSPNRVRLFAGSPSRLTEVPLGSIPASIADMERRHEREKQTQYQPAPRLRTTMGPHGHGGVNVRDAALRSLVKEVSDGVRRELGADRRTPLVLAAVSEHLPLFQSVRSITGLLDEVIPGNPDQASAQDLHAAGWPMIEQVVAQRHAEVSARAQTALAHDIAATGPSDILHAGLHGRIDTLVVGSVDPFAPADLLDQAVQAALNTGATVVLDDSPEALPAIAVLRH